MVWGLYDEVYGIRPWKGYRRASRSCTRAICKAGRAREAQLRSSRSRRRPNISGSTRDMQAAEKAAMPDRSAEIDQASQPGAGAQDSGAQRALPGSAQPHRRADLPDRSHRQREQQGLAAQADRRAEEAEDAQGRRCRGETARSDHELRPDGPSSLQAWKAEKAELLQQRVDLMKPATELRATARQVSLRPHRRRQRRDPRPAAEHRWTTSISRIRQIHIKDVDLVDRCESCHLGTREPVTSDHGRHGRRGGVHQPSRTRSC